MALPPAPWVLPTLLSFSYPHRTLTIRVLPTSTGTINLFTGETTMPRYGNNARGIRKMIADDKAEAHAQRAQQKVCGCGYPPHVGRCQPKIMPTTPQQAVVMLQHIINLFPDEPDVIFVAATAIADIATEAANNGTIVDPLMGSDFEPQSPDDEPPSCTIDTGDCGPCESCDNESCELLPQAEESISLLTVEQGGHTSSLEILPADQTSN